MWEPAVSGMEKAHNCADLSYRRIRRYSVWRLKRLEARDFSHVRFTAIVAGEYTAAILSGNKMGFVLFEIIARWERGFDKGDFVVIPYQIYDSSNAEKYLLSLS